jgi:CelD/BcsL family acetyltransferase involved in cellulose biosynthesis
MDAPWPGAVDAIEVQVIAAHPPATSAPPADLLIVDDDGLDAIEGTWRALWERTEPVPPMLEFRWIRQWWRLHAREGRLAVLVTFDEQRQPLGLAPLYLRDEGITHPSRCLRTIGFLGTGEAVRDEVAGEYTTWLAPPWAMPIVTARVLARLTATAGSWDRLQLDCLWPGADIEGPLRRGLEATAARIEVEARPSFRSPVRPLDEYLRAMPSANYRHRCRRALREGQDQGVELVRARTVEEAAEMFGALETLHQRRWQRRGEPGVFSSPVFRSFQLGLLERYVNDGSAWLVGLRRRAAPGVDQRWLAVRYLLQAGGRLYDYLSGVDTEVSAALAPGLLLHLQTIQAAAAAGIQVYDLMAGDADYKRHLTLEHTDLPSLEVYAPTLRARLWLAARELRRGLAQARARVRANAQSGKDDGNGGNGGSKDQSSRSATTGSTDAARRAGP